MRNIIFPLLGVALLTSCNIGGHRVRGNGHIKSENRTISSFTKLDVSGDFDVYLSQDSATSVRIEADENLMEYIRVGNDGQTLVIEPEDHTNLDGSKDIKVYVSSPVYRELEASGACELIGQDTIRTTSLDIKLTGASDIDMQLDAPDVKARLSGAGSIKLAGKTKNFSVDGSGSVSIKCAELFAENVAVEISGAGSAHVFASVKLDVRVSGAGDVKYKGNAVVTKSISGAGSVTKEN